MEFPGLEPTSVGIESPLRSAQRFLASAYDSVAGLFNTTYPAVRATRESSRGRLTHAEHDVFRAAVVFAGAGLDAVFKEAVRKTVRVRIEQSDAAREKYLDFVVRQLKDGPAVDVKSLARILVDGDPDRTLKDAYVSELTGSSLQSTEQVTTTLTALGLTDERHLYLGAKSLKPLFRARNQIAHELDMTSSAIRGRGQRSRHERSIQAYKDMCHHALN